MDNLTRSDSTVHFKVDHHCVKEERTGPEAPALPLINSTRVERLVYWRRSHASGYVSML